jgi:hypothetical protein
MYESRRPRLSFDGLVQLARSHPRLRGRDVMTAIERPKGNRPAAWGANHVPDGLEVYKTHSRRGIVRSVRSVR